MIRFNEIDLDAYGRRFLENASTSLPQGSKIGLVGLNGVGKSTLFKLMMGDIQTTTGEVSWPSRWRLGTVDQEIAASPQPLIEAVLERDRVRNKLLNDLNYSKPEDMASIHDQLISIGANEAPARAAEILTGLGFKPDDIYRPVSDFSGGWRMRAALGGVLLAEPELLLLDEPTNYLDLEGNLWLEEKLKYYPHNLIIISHDRELLNHSVDHILHLSNKKLTLYKGGYNEFERLRAEKAKLDTSANQKIETERRHLQSFVDRFRAKATKAKQAQSRLKKLEKLPPLSLIQEDQVAPFTLTSPTSPLSPPLIRCEDVSIGYGERTILQNLNFRIDEDDRIGILGVNGAGKSSLAKLLAGALVPKSGQFWKDKRCQVGWFHQHQIEALTPEETPLEMMQTKRPEWPESKRRAHLGSIGFNASKAATACKDLSGGEKARLLLNHVGMDGPHILILDEPTNHLDIDSRRALVDAINSFEGAVLIIAHDRSLLEMVADRFWLLDNGQCQPFDGDLDDYADHVLGRTKSADNSDRDSASSTKGGNQKAIRQARAALRAQLAPLKKAIENIEKNIEAETQKRRLWAELLADSDLYTKDPGKVQTLQQAIGQSLKRSDTLESQWLAAQEDLERAQSEIMID
jgi:ATP-binding cassette subfamily F protein 3